MKSKLVVLLAGTLPIGWAAMSAAPPSAKRAPAPAPPVSAVPLLKASCVPCHNAADPKGGLDLTSLKQDFANPDNYATWVRIHDRTQNGEMPPKGTLKIAPAQRAKLVAGVAASLTAFDNIRTRTQGRSTWRRMNRDEYENTVRDILGAPWLQIKEMLPEDGIRNRSNKVGEALDVSHVQMSRYLAAAEYALRETMVPRAEAPKLLKRKYYARQQGSFTGPADIGQFNGAFERATWPMLGNTPDRAAQEGKAPMTVGDKDPARREEEAIGYVCSAYEPIEPKFDQFHAPQAGKYKIKISGYSFWTTPESEKWWWRPHRDKAELGRTIEPITVYAEAYPRQLRRVGTFDLVPEKSAKESTPHELTVWLRKGESIRPDPARFFRSRPPYPWRNPHATRDGQPAVAFRWMEVEGPIVESFPTPGHQLLFGALPLKNVGGGSVEATPFDAAQDSRHLLRQFMKRAWRRPVTDTDIEPYVRLAAKSMEAGLSFTDAQLTAYSAVLCAPAFVTLEEKPGALDSVALANRLSYFLWNTEPDARLRKVAADKAITKAAVLTAEANRLLDDPKAKQFVDAFLDYWLDLRKAAIVSPDEILYVDYYLDDLLVESAVDEARVCFSDMITRNRPASELVQADYVHVNGRLATLYGIPDVHGAAFRRVQLPKDSVRGGFLTMAGVLKVTANGTTTSPVVRGAWVTERIMGLPVPPPPKAVPAVEPDIRGATTIRQQLAKHTSEPACRDCHVKIDPPGFALEAFDVFGGFRENYRALGPGTPLKGYGPNGQPFTFHAGMKIDPSGVLLDGRKFADIRELKTRLAANDRQLARNLVNQLVVFATGAPVRFGDRPEVESILDRAKPTHYGVKSLIHGLIQSRLFRNK